MTMKKSGSAAPEGRVSRWKYRLFGLICGLFPMRKEILFESFPDFSCNSYALYEYCLRQGLDRDYKLTWLVDASTGDNPLAEGVGTLAFPTSVWGEIKFYFRCNRARAIFCSNRHVPKYKVSKRQLNVYLDHGSQLKRMSNMNPDGSRYHISCDYLVCQSPFFVPYSAREYTLAEEQIVCTGLPRNDQLFHPGDSITKLAPERGRYGKVILWAPTFRAHKNRKRRDCAREYPLGLPLLNSEGDARQLNETLARENVLLIVKPHPAQRMDIMKSFELSNVVFLYNQELSKAGVQLNGLLAQTDAMITDYSSIYYDYLLLHRPIALTLDDYDDYAGEKGFVFDDPLEVLKGDYLYTVADFCRFVEDVAHGVDRARTAREAVCDMVHLYQDDGSSGRVYEFMMAKLAPRKETRE